MSFYVLDSVSYNSANADIRNAQNEYACRTAPDPASLSLYDSG